MNEEDGGKRPLPLVQTADSQQHERGAVAATRTAQKQVICRANRCKYRRNRLQSTLEEHIAGQCWETG
jgi:hypothetical protein